jgi:hypothetical protein
MSRSGASGDPEALALPKLGGSVQNLRFVSTPDGGVKLQMARTSRIENGQVVYEWEDVLVEEG